MKMNDPNSDFTKKIACWLLMVLFALPLKLYAAQIEVETSPQLPRINEAFQLTFTVNGPGAGVPDFSPLNENFEVLNQRQSSQSTWANGRTTQSVSWVLNLMAREQGAVVIPAISFGQDISKPLKLEIQEKQSTEMFLKVSAKPENPYIQSQIIYTWQFYRRADVEISNARMNEPKVENAVRLQLGDNRQFSTKIGDVEYRVTEGHYAIFPQQSGILSIPPLALTAEVLDREAGNSGGFFRFQRSSARRVVSNTVEVEVLPIPSSYSASPWLAAQQLELSEKWSDEALQLTVGESLTRTLSLRATGVLKSQLPELNTALDEAGLTAYADKPLLAERAFSEGVSALREEKIAIIAARAGEYVLPEIELSWFNTLTGKPQIARLAARNLTVREASGQLKPGEGDALQLQATLTSPGEAVPELKQVSGKLESRWFWETLSALLAIGWALTIAYFWSIKKKTPIADTGRQSERVAATKFSARLKAACKENDAPAARQALMDWGKLTYQADTLDAVYLYCSLELQRQISLLEQTLYSTSGLNWKGDELWQAFALDIGSEREPDRNESPLAPLYPRI